MLQDLVNGKDVPYICTPLTGNNTESLLSELAVIIPKQPDIIEWRLDFFDDIDSVDAVILTLEKLHEHGQRIPLLVTIRSQKEGGQAISLSTEEVVELLCEMSKSKYVSMVDFELANDPAHIAKLRDVSKQHNTLLVLSHHNFEKTPPQKEILKRLLQMEFYGADIAKVAVMPLHKNDVHALLEVTKEASETLEIPVITMSMGELGAISRVMGWFYGSVVTFAVGEKSSAPGQIPIETLRQIVHMVKQPS
ncbi:type I 3-dehydroquinate dehydratase [Bacillus alkalicellulosilyticus]|uniref:type I 3-dehydroquinate dehydratase n=1 Tax=Alkalihalobacterium alkalicellulosilyticum TaxID=1912214 RepID=UPI000996A6A7|nr:type I 3-dehydroquinate dehydratase [Bacillus alkalicellulosilyticus]